MTNVFSLDTTLRRVLLAIALCLVGFSAAADGLRVDQAWARASPPGVDNAAAYFRLNIPEGGRPDRLVGVVSPERGEASLHATVTRDGQTRMERLDGVDLAPGTPVAFEPGGRHVMITDLDDGLSAGEALRLVLRFQNRAERELSVPVKPLNASGP